MLHPYSNIGGIQKIGRRCSLLKSQLNGDGRRVFKGKQSDTVARPFLYGLRSGLLKYACQDLGSIGRASGSSIGVRIGTLTASSSTIIAATTNNSTNVIPFRGLFNRRCCIVLKTPVPPMIMNVVKMVRIIRHAIGQNKWIKDSTETDRWRHRLAAAAINSFGGETIFAVGTSGIDERV